MKGINLNNDPLFDALKNAFDDYQPDFNADDMNADWSNVKTQINAPQVGNVSKPNIPKGFKSLLNLKNIIISSVTGVALVATTVVILNQQKVSDNQISSLKINTTSIQPSTSNHENINVIPENQDNKQPNLVTVNKSNIVTQKEFQTNTERTSTPGNSNYSSFVQQNVANNVQNPSKISQQPNIVVAEIHTIPRIIISEKGFPNQDEVYISDTQFCQNQSILISYNFKEPDYQKMFVSVQGKALYSDKSIYSYQFAKAGWYNLTLVIQNYNSTMTKSYRINVVVSPAALFNISLNESPTIRFKNLSKYADNYLWMFGDNSTSNSDNPIHTYIDTATYKVTLIAGTDGVCTDTIEKYIHVQSFVEPEIPNTFSPNNDGINDEFYIKINNETLYELTIFDRNSNLIFSSKNKNEKWNGNYKDSNKQCSEGTYYYFLNYKVGGQAQSSVKTGTITLFR